MVSPTLSVWTESNRGLLPKERPVMRRYIPFYGTEEPVRLGGRGVSVPRKWNTEKWSFKKCESQSYLAGNQIGTLTPEVVDAARETLLIGH